MFVVIWFSLGLRPSLFVLLPMLVLLIYADLTIIGLSKNLTHTVIAKFAFILPLFSFQHLFFILSISLFEAR